MDEEKRYDFLLELPRYQKLIDFAERLSSGKSRTKFQADFEKAIHNQVVALRLDGSIKPGLHYALNLVKKLVFKKILSKSYRTEKRIKIEADKKLMALIFHCSILNGELPCNDIYALYKQLDDERHAKAYDSLSIRCPVIADLCCQIIDNLIK